MTCSHSSVRTWDLISIVGTEVQFESSALKHAGVHHLREGILFGLADHQILGSIYLVSFTSSTINEAGAYFLGHIGALECFI